ncbi:MAG: hypothetical protein B7Y43_01955 [Sphingomonas sp. 28-62-20]|uniref:hypothetical protein n=1 Tax=Sphingomonas sp. 28-62-20 TaxID=1970433 RepID=UPI000BC58602|nr:MAG: hypothetical protein B7Y43_01955 [Sphingomonas sp. 28-62-20]
MELLLILSALLSALTGVTAGMSTPEVRLHQSVAPAAIATAAAQSAGQHIARQIAQDLPTLSVSASVSPGKGYALRPATPLYLARLRE